MYTYILSECVSVWEAFERACVCMCATSQRGAAPEGLCVRAAGAVRWSCSVRMMCWNHLNPLLQLQHLPACSDQSERRAKSHDESAHSVIFSENPGGGIGTKDRPLQPRNAPVASTLSILPTTFWLWCVRPLRGGTVFPVYTSTPHLNTSNPMDHDRKMTEGLISRERFTYIHWKAVFVIYFFILWISWDIPIVEFEVWTFLSAVLSVYPPSSSSSSSEACLRPGVEHQRPSNVRSQGLLDNKWNPWWCWAVEKASISGNRKRRWNWSRQLRQKGLDSWSGRPISAG